MLQIIQYYLMIDQKNKVNRILRNLLNLAQMIVQIMVSVTLLQVNAIVTIYGTLL